MKNKLIPKLTSYPTITLLFIWMAVPLGMTIYFSFLKYSLMYPDVQEFTGFLNYEYFLTDFAFLEALWNTFVLVFSVLIASVTFGLGFSILLNQNFFGRGFARILAIAPFFIMPTVSALIWKNLFMNPVSGLFAWLLSLFGLGPIDWFTHYPMLSIIIIVSWQWIPFATLILLTSLQSVDKDQIEASRIDGANNVQIFRYVVLPHLSRPIAIIILIETIFLLTIFAEIFVTTTGGPGLATTNLAFLVFTEALLKFDIGVASAGGVIVVILANIAAFFLVKMIGKNLQ
ncbi:sugar ABC transporter permease [Candidatus Pelagibacter ubique]|nr:sugar ABC transporter permease [Candidatus Pelagibacter bacterium]MDA7456817.1 sugar ABC transporter permease [Candidatus Pelagibacter ubique]MDA7488238.1 sugar ABC transporter permease [Candidatus Pelagibacter ubique]MDA8848739.1 sugar ABC transporter permease [Candidatus Pelagibacter ubique]MDB2601701.1 sugar ABC transporter permease [Candidatus Pelagibacter bacterium]MDC3355895.1 sugar ABC transporter permease [Candidatus Pelagibacter ubique]